MAAGEVPLGKRDLPRSRRVGARPALRPPAHQDSAQLVGRRSARACPTLLVKVASAGNHQQKLMKTFRCSNCGFQVQRPAQPFSCPQCGRQAVGLFKVVTGSGQASPGGAPPQNVPGPPQPPVQPRPGTRRGSPLGAPPPVPGIPVPPRPMSALAPRPPAGTAPAWPPGLTPQPPAHPVRRQHAQRALATVSRATQLPINLRRSWRSDFAPPAIGRRRHPHSRRRRQPCAAATRLAAASRPALNNPPCRPANAASAAHPAATPGPTTTERRSVDPATRARRAAAGGAGSAGQPGRPHRVSTGVASCEPAGPSAASAVVGRRRGGRPQSRRGRRG